MLETQGRYQNKERKQGNLREAPLAVYSALAISALLPESADVSGRCTGVASDKVAWAHGASNVGALWKVLSLVAGGEDAAVTSWSGSAPGSYLTFFGHDCKCPSGVDEFYCSPADQVLSKDINNPYALIVNLNSGKPKEQQGSGGNKGYAGKGQQSCGNALTNQDYYPRQTQNDNARESYGSAGSGSEYLHAKSLACHREVLS